MNDILDSDIKFVSGVGEVRANLFAKELGLRTIRDLLFHVPFRYIDRTKVYRIREINDDQHSLVQFRARILHLEYVGDGTKKRLVATVSDGESRAELIWFKSTAWAQRQLEIGREYLIFGRPSIFNNRLSMVHPEMEGIDKVLSRATPIAMQGIYSSTERLTTTLGIKGMQTIMAAALRTINAKVVDYLPDSIRLKHNLLGLEQALYNVHFPQSAQLQEQARHRLKFDELLGVQLNIQSRRTERHQRLNGTLFNRVGDLFNGFYSEKLPFPLTGAQKRVIKQIRQDCVSGYQMNRLLQGDVGSGKTIVALMSMLLAVDNGFQAAIMAPTEILARQHFASISKMCEGLPIKIGVLTGSSKAKERRESIEGTAAGEINILVGTHALIEQKVGFQKLGLVIIDEQHRFGVEQRAKLWNKSAQPPHILVMTATPIPRTLAMTLYGDLEVSVIDELPPGRQPIKTMHCTDSQRLRVQGFIKEQIAQGRQAYVVFPLIEGSEKMDYKDLDEGYESIIRDFPRPEYQAAVCHGKMKPADKEAAMQHFKSGQAQILVATSVIEVGVDVPNASVIVIESAERFGLSQLHQLRGRVGRGSHQSFCILMSGHKLSTEGRRRLEAMCETNDGFRLSELDLQLRGAGDINGTQQSGEALQLRVANPTLDAELLEVTRDVAATILETDSTLSTAEYAPLQRLRLQYGSRAERDFSMIS